MILRAARWLVGVWTVVVVWQMLRLTFTAATFPDAVIAATFAAVFGIAGTVFVAVVLRD